MKKNISASVNNMVLNNSKNYKKFDLNKAFNSAYRNKFVTRDGHKVKIICLTRGKILAKVYDNMVSYNDRTYKFNLDGSRYSTNLIHNLDLMMTE